MTPDRALGFRSLDTEIDQDLTVEGEMPTWLSGILIRNGPGSFAVGDREVGHWFDGLAMVHVFSFGVGEGPDTNADSDGTGNGVAYRNRFLHTDAYRRVQSGEFAGGFATGETTLRDRLRAFLLGKPYDNTNIIVERIGKRFFALTETPRWVEIDPRTIETMGDVRYQGPEPRGQLACAHLERDPVTDRLVNFEIEFGRQSRYHVYEMNSPNRREHVVSIPVDKPGYMHSFALTPRYVVLTEFPLVVDPTKALRPGKQGPFITNFEWKPERGTRFFVIDRDRKRVIAAPRTDPVFGFHHVNAYEATGGSDESDSEGDGMRERGIDRELVIDLETVPDANSIGASLSELREGDMEIPGGEIDRFRVRIYGRADAEIDRETVYPGATGLPTVSPARWCRDYRYVYSQKADQPMTDWPKALVKLDVESRSTMEFTDGGNYLGEPIFVPRPESGRDDRESRFPVRAGGDGDVGDGDVGDGDVGDGDVGDGDVGGSGYDRDRPEDDGVVLVLSLDTDTERSALLVLDAETFAERARARVPHAIPFDFHGRYFPELR